MNAVKYKTLILDEISTALDQVPEESSNRLADQILRASRVFITGAGRSGLMMKAFAMRLMHLGLAVHVVGETTAPGIGGDDLLLIGSCSGETDSLLAGARKAKKNGAALALVTGYAGSSIGVLADVIVNIPATTPKVAGSGSPLSRQPMGTCFEQCLLLYLDALILQLMEKTGQNADRMFARHANLEQPQITSIGSVTGKSSARYPKNGGLLLAPQLYPNAMACANFPSMVLRPGEAYHRRTKYRFIWL